jgi:hypothetical protein
LPQHIHPAQRQLLLRQKLFQSFFLKNFGLINLRRGLIHAKKLISSKDCAPKPTVKLALALPNYLRCVGSFGIRAEAPNFIGWGAS